MWTYIETDYDNDYLQHFGILGQKWGIRRFQNEDGSLTPLGKKRYGVKNYNDLSASQKREVTKHDSDLKKELAEKKEKQKAYKLEKQKLKNDLLNQKEARKQAEAERKLAQKDLKLELQAHNDEVAMKRGEQILKVVLAGVGIGMAALILKGVANNGASVAAAASAEQKKEAVKQTIENGKNSAKETIKKAAYDPPKIDFVKRAKYESPNLDLFDLVRKPGFKQRG